MQGKEQWAKERRTLESAQSVRMANEAFESLNGWRWAGLAMFEPRGAEYGKENWRAGGT
jgi:hypothetical protein